MQAVELPSLVNANESTNEKIEYCSRRTMQASAKVFAFLYLILLTYLVVTAADDVAATNDDMLLFLSVRVCAYWSVLVFLFFAFNLLIVAD